MPPRYANSESPNDSRTAGALVTWSLPAHPRHAPCDRRLVAPHRGDLVTHTPFGRLGAVGATRGPGPTYLVRLVSSQLMADLQQPLDLMLGQDRGDGLLQLPAGRELGPARPRRRRQAAQGRLGFLQPAVQGRGLALGRTPRNG